LVERRVQSQPLLQDGDEDLNCDGDRDLGLHRIQAMSVECFDSQVLLNPFVEEFHLQARLLQSRDDESREIKVIGQENEPNGPGPDLKSGYGQADLDNVSPKPRR
jgi:hypothetical protein